MSCKPVHFYITFLTPFWKHGSVPWLTGLITVLKLYDSTLCLFKYNYFKNASILWYLIIIFRSTCSHIIKKGIYYNKNIQDRFFMVLHVGKMRGKMFKIKDIPTGKAFTTSLFPWNSQFYCSSSFELTSCNQTYNCQKIH